MYLIGGIASGYGGYLLNVCYQPGKDINYFLNRLDQVMVAPFANYWNETSLKAIILGIFVYVIGMVMYVTSRKNYMPGQEFGTAVFADPKKVAKQFADKDEHNNLILSQNVRLSMNTRKTRRNLNVLVIGGSGAGKTLFIRPVLHVSSVNDELLSAVGKLAAEYGRIGGNLNQIARYLNEYGAPYHALSGEVRAAIADLAALKYEVLKKVGDAVGNTQTYQL